MHVIGVEPEFAAEVDGGIEEMDAMEQLVAHGDTNVLMVKQNFIQNTTY